MNLDAALIGIQEISNLLGLWGGVNPPYLFAYDCNSRKHHPNQKTTQPLEGYGCDALFPSREAASALRAHVFSRSVSSSTSAGTG